jgi:hypothetical protein
VKIYARAVAEAAWTALAGGETGEKADRLFDRVIAGVTNVQPAEDSEPILI